MKKLLEKSRLYNKLAKSRNLKKNVSKEEWNLIKYRNYRFKKNLNSMKWSIAKKSLGRISIVGVSLLLASILVLLATLMPNTLKIFKSSALNGFGDYSSYSEYKNQPLNGVVPKWNMGQQVSSDDAANKIPNKGNQNYTDGTKSTFGSASYFGGFDPLNGGIGADNRYSTFNASDENQIGISDNLTSGSIANLQYFSYLGGLVISYKWVLNLDKTATGAGPLICDLLGVPSDKRGDGSQSQGVACVEYLVNQNAPSYIRAKLFGGQGTDFSISFDSVEFNSLTDNLFTHVDGKIDREHSTSEIWGLEPNGNYGIKSKKNNNLWQDFLDSSKSFKGSGIFPCLVNRAQYNDLHHSNLLLANDEFEYDVPMKVLVTTPKFESVTGAPGLPSSITTIPAGTLLSPNRFFWFNDEGLSVYYDFFGQKQNNFNYSSEEQSKKIDAQHGLTNTSGDNNNYGFLSTGNGDGSDDQQIFLKTTGNYAHPYAFESVDYLTANGFIKEETVNQKITMKILGVSDNIGDKKIYTTHSEANELSGYFNPSSYDHYFFANGANSLYTNSDTFNNTSSDWTKNSSNSANTIDSIAPGGIIDATPSATSPTHIASDGSISSEKLYSDPDNNINNSYIAGGYSLFGRENDIYFNGKLTTKAENTDITNFSIYSNFGAYDRFGLAPSFWGIWDGSNNPFDKIPAPGDPNPTTIPFKKSDAAQGKPQPSNTNGKSIDKPSAGIPNLLNLYSKSLIEQNISRITSLVLIVLYSILGFFLVISLIIVLVSTNIIIDDNKKNISGFKIMGYSDSDITKIIIGIYYYVAIIAFLIAIPIVLLSFNYVINLIGSLMNLNIKDSGLTIWSILNIWEIPLSFVLIMIIYVANVMVNRITLNKIQPIEVMKGQ